MATQLGVVREALLAFEDFTNPSKSPEVQSRPAYWISRWCAVRFSDVRSDSMAALSVFRESARKLAEMVEKAWLQWPTWRRIIADLLTSTRMITFTLATFHVGLI